MKGTFSKVERWLIPLSLAVLTVLVFWRVGQNEFICYDDPDYVTQNVIVQRGLTADGLAWAFGQLRGEYTYWHPLTWVSHMVDCQLFGLRAGPHHLVNLGFHVLNVLLLFSVTRRMTGELWPSAVLAALWAVHPLQVDTVAWVTERKNLLSGMFWLLTTLAYLRYAERPSLRRYVWVLLGMVLGLMTKPVLVTLPFALLLLDLWPLRRWQGLSAGGNPSSDPTQPARFPPQSWRRLVAEKVPLLLFSAASGVLTLFAHQQLGVITSGEEFPLGARLASALLSYEHYVGKTLLPVGLAVFYPLVGPWPAWQVVGGVVMVLGLLGIALWRGRQAPWLLVGWSWFLGVLVPTIGIVQAGAQSTADRFMYLPLIGLLIVLVWGGRALLLWVGTRPGALPAIAGALVLACGLLSSVQVQQWRTSRTLFEHTLRVTSYNYLAHAVLGSLDRETGHFAGAEAHYWQAVTIKTNYVEAHSSLADLLRAQQKLDDAITHYNQALRWRPAYVDALSGLGAALFLQGKPQEALTQLDRALQLSPDLSSAQLHRALALHALGREAEAAEQFNRVLRSQPGSVNTLVSVGNSLLAQRRFSEAVLCYRQVLAVQPDSVPALNRLAWLLATHNDASVRNGADALRFATHACQLTANKDALSLSALAAAYAENGEFDKAVSTAQRALDLATASGQKPLADIFQKLIELYKGKTPYRE